MTSTINEIDIVELIDYEADTPCAVENCSAEVEWIHIRKCCGIDILYCTEHHDRDINFISNNPLIHCNFCGVKFFWATIDELIIVNKV
jgi:hypothetical protein